MNDALLKRIVFLVYALFAVVPATAVAEEYLYDNGVFVGLGAQASIMSRDRGINYGFPAFCPPPEFCTPQKKGFKGTDISDTAPSPVLTVGYKFTDWDSISVKGDWARYNVDRHLVATDATGFSGLAVDGFNGVFIPPFAGDTGVDIHWDSDVVNAALEYQRRVMQRDMSSLFGLLGFKLRYERQTFDVKAVNPTLVPSIVADSNHERLTEYLFGPYAGLKLGLKPDKASRWSFGFRGNIGWYFKSAFFDGRDRLFNGQHFSRQDHSNDGTLFADAGVNIVYAITKNWFVDAGYDFSWIQSASHIFNAGKTPGVNSTGIPSRITGTQVLTHTPGIKLIYKFD
jgi:opacity protein-like surface antigen